MPSFSEESSAGVSPSEGGRRGSGGSMEVVRSDSHDVMHKPKSVPWVAVSIFQQKEEEPAHRRKAAQTRESRRDSVQGTC